MGARFVAWADGRLPALYALVALGVCGLLCVVTAPFFGPDEANQACRAISLAHGYVVEQKGGDEAGGPIDSGALAAMDGMNDLRMHWEKGTVDFHHRPYGPTPLPSLGRLNKIRWSGHTVFVPFGNTAPYPPFLYVPAALGWRLGEQMGLTIFWSLRLARGCCALISILLGWVALRVGHSFRWQLLAYLLLPTLLFYTATCSQDAVLLGMAALIVAMVARAVAEVRELAAAELVGAASMLAIIAMARPPYGALSLLLLVPGMRRRGTRLRRWERPLAGMGVVIGAMFGWHQLAAGLGFDTADEASPDLQFIFVEAHPWRALAAVLRGTFEAAWDLVHRGTYVLGWNDLLAPWWLRVAADVGLLLAVVAGCELKLSGRVRGVLAVAAGAALFGISAAEYVIWTPPGLSTVYGIMPRYWLPVLPVLMLLFACLRIREEIRIGLRFTLLVVVLGAAASLPFVAAQAFYLEPLSAVLRSVAA